MFRRRRTTGPRTVTTKEEALSLAEELRERAKRLQETPGLLDGAVEEIHSALERVMRMHHRVSGRGMVGLIRDLEPVAARAKELRAQGLLSARQEKLVGQAAQHIRRVHYWNAHKAVDKLSKGLEPLKQWQADLDVYREFYTAAAERARVAEAEVDRLRAVPKPPEGQEAVWRLREVSEACNRAADSAWSRLISRPATEAISDLIVHPDVQGLGLLSTLEFACLRELYELFEAQGTLKEDFGSLALSELVATSEYSVGKWDRVFPRDASERKRLQGLFHQLRPVVSGRYGASFDVHLEATGMERRVASWRRIPGGDATAMRELAELVASGRVPSIQEALRIYEDHGELAVRAWDSRLAEDLGAAEKELLAATKALTALPAPDSLAG